MKINSDLLIDSKINGNIYANDFECKNLFKYDNYPSQSTFVCPCEVGDVFTLSFTGRIKNTTDTRLFLRTYSGIFSKSLDSYSDSVIINLTTTDNYYSVTLTSTVKGVLYIRTATGIDHYVLNNIQVERGSQATKYTKHNLLYDNFYSGEGETIVGTWMTGKPIYRRVIEMTTPSLTVPYDYSWLSVENLDISILVNYYAIIIKDDVIITTPFVFDGNNNSQHIDLYYNSSAKYIHYATNTNMYNGKSARLILEYTKASDLI